MTEPVVAFNEALAAFQAEIPHIAKGQKATVKSDKGNYSYEYADLTDITQIALPLLAKLGLSFTSKPMISDGGFVLRYTLRHAAGHEDTGDFPLPDPSKFSAQQIGSWLTYARRYALCAVTGIAPGGDDDDAAGAGDARSADITQAPQRAARRSNTPAAEPDPWQTAEPARVTDAAWIDGFRHRIALAGKASELRGLQEEANVQWAEHRLSREDAVLLKAEVAQREAELKGALV